jgi:hypothetical protein
MFSLRFSEFSLLAAYFWLIYSAMYFAESIYKPGRLLFGEHHSAIGG